MVDRRPATVVILLGRATLFACRGAGVRAYLSMPFYAAFQAPCVASGGTRGRALWALKQKTGPVGLRFPPLRGGASVFQLAPRYPPSASWGRSEEHTSELQSLMRTSYAVFCLKKKILRKP